jgi:uncharacterized membrane protein YhaH (DUF805 family)
MPLSELLFSFKGRIRRLHWWVASLAVGAVVGIAVSILQFAPKLTGNVMIIPETQQPQPTGPFAVALGAIAIANIWINFARGVKRLHDRDRSGWWLVLQFVILTVALIVFVAGFVMLQDQAIPTYVVGSVVGLAGLIITFWLFIEMGFLRGTRGPNRFGADPFGQTQADAGL